MPAGLLRIQTSEKNLKMQIYTNYYHMILLNSFKFLSSFRNSAREHSLGEETDIYITRSLDDYAKGVSMLWLFNMLVLSVQEHMQMRTSGRYQTMFQRSRINEFSSIN